MIDLLRWEWFKLRSRRIIWTLLAVLVGFASLVVFIRFVDYQIQKDRPVIGEVVFRPGTPVVAGLEVDLDCDEFEATGALPDDIPEPFTAADVDFDRTGAECRKERADIGGRIDRLVGAFTLPGAIPTALRWTGLLAIPLVAFLTVLVVGSEYGWGTLRTVLMRGTGRSRLLAAKLILVALALAVTWVAITLVIIVSALISTAFASGVDHGSWTAGVAREVAVDVWKAWFAALPYVALAALLSVFFSKWSGGVLAAAGLSIAYFFVDLFSVGRLIKLFADSSATSWFANIAEFDLGWNSAAWMFGEGGEPIPGFALGGAIGVADYPGDVHAFLALLAYLVVIGGLAFWLFNRRDVAGAGG